MLISEINSAYVPERFNTELLLQLLMNANFPPEFEEDSEFESEIEKKLRNLWMIRVPIELGS